MPEQSQDTRAKAKELLDEAGAGMAHRVAPTDEQRLLIAVRGVGYAILALVDRIGGIPPQR